MYPAPAPHDPPPAVSPAARVIGLLLAVPAIVLTLVIPTVRTVRASLRSGSLFPGAESA